MPLQYLKMGEEQLLATEYTSDESVLCGESGPYEFVPDKHRIVTLRVAWHAMSTGTLALRLVSTNDGRGVTFATVDTSSKRAKRCVKSGVRFCNVAVPLVDTRKIYESMRSSKCVLEVSLASGGSVRGVVVRMQYVEREAPVRIHLDGLERQRAKMLCKGKSKSPMQREIDQVIREITAS